MSDCTELIGPRASDGRDGEGQERMRKENPA